MGVPFFGGFFKDSFKGVLLKGVPFLGFLLGFLFYGGSFLGFPVRAPLRQFLQGLLSRGSFEGSFKRVSFRRGDCFVPFRGHGKYVVDQVRIRMGLSEN